jgi:hypothetical protein
MPDRYFLSLIVLLAVILVTLWVAIFPHRDAAPGAGASRSFSTQTITYA